VTKEKSFITLTPADCETSSAAGLAAAAVLAAAVAAAAERVAVAAAAEVCAPQSFPAACCPRRPGRKARTSGRPFRRGRPCTALRRRRRRRRRRPCVVSDALYVVLAKESESFLSRKNIIKDVEYG
jgi:hypothetical protein